MTTHKNTNVGDYDVYVESCRARRIIPCDRVSYERDACAPPLVENIDVAYLQRELEETTQNDCDRPPDEVAADALAVIRSLLALAGAALSDTEIPVSPAHDQRQLATQRDATDAAARASALRQLAMSTAPGSAGSPLRGSFAKPVTYPGELYAGIFRDPDVGPLHLILLPGDARVGNIEDAQDFVASLGGELPTYAEFEHLHKCMRDRFRPSFYYTCEQEECDDDTGTMLYDFAGGGGGGDREAQSGVRYIRARAVRRAIVA